MYLHNVFVNAIKHHKWYCSMHNNRTKSIIYYRWHEVMSWAQAKVAAKSTIYFSLRCKTALQGWGSSWEMPLLLPRGLRKCTPYTYTCIYIYIYIYIHMYAHVYIHIPSSKHICMCDGGIYGVNCLFPGNFRL